MSCCHVLWAVYRRNVAAYFSSVLGYLFIVVFVVAAASLAYTPAFFANNVATLDQLNEVFPLLLLFFVPAITMSAWADEKKLGTEELLFTLPGRDVEILLGKYLAVLTVYSIALAFSLLQLFVLGLYANPDWGLLFATYVGYWLAGAALLSAGMFASALTSSATVAFVLGVALCAIPVYMREIVQMIAVVDGVADRLLSSDYAVVVGVGNVLRFVFDFIAALEFEQLSLREQFTEFGLGMIPLSGLIYFGSLTAFMLYLNHVVITRRHWSGMQKANMRLQYVVRTLCLIVILTSANVMTRASADTLGLRADVTADDTYTLSQTTRELLAAVDDQQPVTIQAFISNDVPQEYVSLRKRLIGLLKQYDRLGGNDVEVRIVEVGDAYSKDAIEAGNLGLIKQQTQTERGGRVELAEFYLGAVFTSPRDEVVIPAFSIETPAEYELTRSIRTVSGKKRRTVGVLTTDAAIMGGFDRNTFRSLPSWHIVSELQKQYNVEQISPDQPYDEQASLELFRLKGAHAASLDEKKLSDDIRREYAANGVALGDGAMIEVDASGGKWQIDDDENALASTVVKQGDDLVVFGNFDVLLAVLPSSLSQPQMERLVDAVREGLPTLIFDDPMPVTVGMQHAPMVPKQPPGGMMGQQGPPPTPRADNGMATSLMETIGVIWHSDEGPGSELVTVFDYFNPHPRLGELVSPEAVAFVSRDSGVDKALNPESRITAGLRQILTVYPGRIMEDPRVEGLEFEELLLTGTNSGILKWSDMFEESSPFGGPTPKRNIARYTDKYAYILGARVKSKKPGSGPNVVYVADVDLLSNDALVGISDYVRRSFDNYDLQLDNIEFVLNSIDLLAGDEEMIDLRNHEARKRPLTEIQKQVDEFRKQRKAEEDARDKEWDKEMEENRKKLEAAQKNRGEEDFGTVVQRLITTAQAAEQRMKQREREIEQEKQQTLDRLKGEERAQIRSLETRIRWWAVLLPPIPPIMLGVLLLGLRAYREESTIQPSRSVKT